MRNWDEEEEEGWEDDAPREKLPQNNENHLSQQEVAILLGVSRSRVSEIESRALLKFKTILLRRYKEEDF
jgi:DNA-directed RNA polymerase sigma subunit (sigma70/sigma32)